MVPTPISATNLTLIFARRVNGFQIIDELRQILDAIDVMMGGRANQGDAWRTVAQYRQFRSDLVARLAAFAWFGALRHLDLEHPRRSSNTRASRQSARCHLFDLAGTLGEIAFLGLAPFAAVAHTAQGDSWLWRGSRGPLSLTHRGSWRRC